MILLEEEQLDFEDVMLKPKVSDVNSRKDVDIYRTFVWTRTDGKLKSFKAIPVMSANMYSVGSVKMCSTLAYNGMMGCLEKHIDKEEVARLYEDLSNNVVKDVFYRVFTSVGLRDSLDKLKYLGERFEDISICIDAPNGTIPMMFDRIAEVRRIFPNSLIMAGNVACEEVIWRYRDATVNIVKGGISGGSCCLSRSTAGAGRPVFQTAVELSKICNENAMYYCSDGGCKCCGDVVKALAAGSDIVMTNSLFCQCEEANGEIVEKNGKRYRRVFGMSSITAQNMLFGGFRENEVASEGRDILVEIDGRVLDRIQKICGSIRSGCSYSNAFNLNELRDYAIFYKVRRNLNTVFGNCEKNVQN